MNLAATKKRSIYHNFIIKLFSYWSTPVFSAATALLVYSAFAFQRSDIFKITDTAYYNYLADALLHGQLNLRVLPPTTLDLIIFHGKYYLYWPPFPSFLLMPFVAIFGLNVSDILFTVIIASLNIGLLTVLLNRANDLQIIRLSRAKIGLLVLFFAFGTVHMSLSPHGQVWYTGQIVGCTTVLLMYISGLCLQGWNAFFGISLATAMALLTRTSLVFNAIWPLLYVIWKNWSDIKKHWFTYLFSTALPVLIATFFLGYYNYTRFNNPIDIGYMYHQMNDVFVADFHQYGPFNIHYIPINFYYQYISYPFPIRPDSNMGGSLFLLSPVFFAAFFGINQTIPKWFGWALLGTIFLASIPIFLLMGTGWVQFGPRYTLDFTIPLMLLTAKGVENWKLAILGPLTAISIIHYIIGTLLLV